MSNEWLRKPTAESKKTKAPKITDFQTLVDEYLENAEENSKILVVSEGEDNVFFLVFPEDENKPFSHADFALLTEEGHYAFTPSDMAYKISETYLEYLSLLAEAMKHVNGEEE